MFRHRIERHIKWLSDLGDSRWPLSDKRAMIARRDGWESALSSSAIYIFNNYVEYFSSD